MTPRPRSPRSLNVLLVEGDESVRNVLVAMLTEFGHHVKYYRSPDEAFGALESHRFDLLIAGHARSGGSAFELAGIARAMHPEMKFMLITEASAEAERARHKNNPADFIIEKPFGLAQINAALELLNARS